MKRDIDNMNLAASDNEQTKKKARSNMLKKSGIYFQDDIKAICGLYGCDIDFKKSNAWFPFDETLSSGRLGNLSEENITKLESLYDQELSDNNFPLPFRKRKIYLITPKTTRDFSSAPSGTFGFVLPVVIETRPENQEYCFAALKTSSSFFPSIQESSKNIRFSNSLEDHHVYPSVNMLDCFSISCTSPNRCFHCKLNSIKHKRGNYKDKSNDTETLCEGELSEHSVFDEYVDIKNCNGYIPPNSWWMFWFSFVINSSEKSKDALMDYIKTQIRLSPEDLNEQIITDFWNKRTWIFGKEKRTDLSLYESDAACPIPERNFDNCMIFTITYEFFNTCETGKKDGKEQCDNFEWPLHLDSPEFRRAIYLDMKSKFSENSVKSGQNKNASNASTRNVSDIKGIFI